MQHHLYHKNLKSVFHRQTSCRPKAFPQIQCSKHFPSDLRKNLFLLPTYQPIPKRTLRQNLKTPEKQITQTLTLIQKPKKKQSL